MILTIDQKKQALEWNHPELSLRHQMKLLGLSPGAAYYDPVPMNSFNLDLMDLIDQAYLDFPFYGSRRMVAHLGSLGHIVNRKKVQRLMQLMGLEAIYPKPNLSKGMVGHKIFPYLLKDFNVCRPNQVWSSDITYIRIRGGFVYLVAVIDWFSRYVLAWRLSNSMETQFCLEMLEDALDQGLPEIYNTDQGSQFTSDDFTSRLLTKNIKISMDSKGRALDNIFIERLWRSLKYEEVYLKDYKQYSFNEAFTEIKNYLNFYNNKRFHQSLDYKTPKLVHFAS